MNPTQPPLEISCSRYFIDWLSQQKISLAFTSYQTHRLFLLGVKPDGKISIFERIFDRAMGLYALPNRLYLSSRYQIWQLDNVLNPGEFHQGYDQLYVPRVGYTTGDLDTHDICYGVSPQLGIEQPTLMFVNTLYSCLATLSERHSFKPLWQPPFISKLAPEDRCHLNGMATVEGQVRYMTAISESDVLSGWRNHRNSGGILMDITRNEMILKGLSMPHSPRYSQNKLWLLNSGTGELGFVDFTLAPKFEPITFCPGYLRGLTFVENFAIVGLSKPRERSFSGLPLDEELLKKNATPQCGLMVIDLKSGNVVHWLQIEGMVTEVYDVQVIKDSQRPMALGFKTSEISQVITLETPTVNRVQSYPTSEVSQSIYSEEIPAPPPQETPESSVTDIPTLPLFVSPSAIQYHFISNFTVKAVLEKYESLTFPNLRKVAQSRQIKEPLIGIGASIDSQLMGLILAETRPDFTSAEIISWFVVKPYRNQGIGKQLLAYLEKALTKQGYQALDIEYRSDWKEVNRLEQILQKDNWATPQIRFLLCKTDYKMGEAPWLNQYKLPPEFALFPWSELTASERNYIQEKEAKGEWFPPSLTPFQQEERIEMRVSFGIRYQGQLVGWKISHRIDENTLQATSLFIDPKFQRLGRGIALLVESFRRRVAAGIAYSIFRVDVNNAPMIQFVNRRMRPYLHSVTESRGSRKLLQNLIEV